MPVTERLTADPRGIARAARLVADGRLVALPTETVYGLAANARDPVAVAGIFAAKGRPRFNPLIVHVADLDAARRIADLPEPALLLAAAFWPGPLTVVAPVRSDAGIGDIVTAGLPTVAVRVPSHPLMRAVIEAAGVPVAAPSANRSGRVSPTTAEHVLVELDGLIDAVLDGGRAELGLESTIIGFSPARGGAVPRLLRPGAIPAERIAEALSMPEGALLEPGEAVAVSDISAPGQLGSHYAPGAHLRLAAEAPRPGEAWLGFGPVPETASGPALSLSPAGDLTEAAANLFSHLRALDAALPAGGTIAVAPVPERGLGRAINDRLRRAAAPRR